MSLGAPRANSAITLRSGRETLDELARVGAAALNCTMDEHEPENSGKRSIVNPAKPAASQTATYVRAAFTDMSV